MSRRVVVCLGLLLFMIAGLHCDPNTTPPGSETLPEKQTESVVSVEKMTEKPVSVEAPTVTEKVPDAAPQDVAPPEPKPTALTYYKDIKGIIKNKCLNCHAKGGIGPFALETYDEVFPVRQAVKSAVKDGRMPPWSGAKSCNQYTNDISLTDDEKAKLLKWIDEGAKKGDPADYKEPPPGKKIGLERVDTTLKMKIPYKPNKVPDDHRCFVLDWPHKEKKFITGFQIKAGNLPMVHHVIAYLAHPEEASKYTKKDPNGKGYYCPGTAGGNAGINWIGVWAPGVPGGNYPPGTGIQVDPGSKIIVQVHYNTGTVKDETDQSTVEFRLEDKVDSRAIMIPFTNFASWTRSKGMKIPKGEADTKHSFELPLGLLKAIVPNIKELKIYSAMLHMHQLGTKGELYVKKEQEYQCLLDIPKWDFNWQLAYDLKNPITLTLGDTIGITCHYDNTDANQPIVNGQKQPAKDVYWGDGTADEMCLGVLYVTCGSVECPKLKF